MAAGVATALGLAPTPARARDYLCHRLARSEFYAAARPSLACDQTDGDGGATARLEWVACQAGTIVTVQQNSPLGG